jgi:hypothetical protein
MTRCDHTEVLHHLFNRLELPYYIMYVLDMSFRSPTDEHHGT